MDPLGAVLVSIAPAQAAPPVDLELAIAPPWEVVQQDEHGIALRHGNAGDGVRVTWSHDEAGRVPGVVPVRGGRSAECAQGAQRWPLLAVARPDLPITRVAIEVQGIDLVIRLFGPPLSEVSTHPDAPEDPILTWVRLRPRGEDWRIAVDGLTTLSVPAEGLVVAPADDAAVSLRSPSLGELVFQPRSPAWQSALGKERWSWSNLDSLEALEPYPRTGLTWRPPVSP